MSSITIASALKASLAAPQADKQVRISAKVRTAIEAMVWDGLKRADAATKAGLKDNSLYVAFMKPEVKSYYLGQLEVLRTSERARNIHTLVDVRDQESNQMARVQAVKALEQLDDTEQGRTGHNALPGLQIVIMQGNASQPPTIDVTPRDVAHD